MTRARLAGLVALLIITGAACGGTIDLTATQEADELAIAIPPKMAGLNVALSKPATRRMNREAAGSSAYVRDAQVFALRSRGELRAVYQVLRLTPDARTDDFDFRRTIAGAIGGSRAPENRGGVAVYVTINNEQVIYTWFEDKFMQVLIIREDETIEGAGSGLNVEQLIEEALALQPVLISEIEG
jgi:hypothetical protein